MYETTIRTGKVRVWDVYLQSWRRMPAHAVPATILAALSARERTRIVRAAARYPAAT
jgi:hypothetical protein